MKKAGKDHAMDACMTEEQVSIPQKVDAKALRKAAAKAKLKKKLQKK